MFAEQTRVTQTFKKHSLFKRCSKFVVCFFNFRVVWEYVNLPRGPRLKSRLCIYGKHTSTSRTTFRIRSYQVSNITFNIRDVSAFIYQRHVLNAEKFVMLRNKYYKYSIEINIKQIANNLIIYNVRENICKIFTQTFKSLDIMQQLFHNIIIQKNIYIYI